MEYSMAPCTRSALCTRVRTRRSLTLAAIPMALVISGLSGRLTAQSSSNGRLDSSSVARWRADLDFLGRAMPAQHTNLFHTMQTGQFDSALSSIRSRLPSLTRRQVIVELERLAALIGDGHSSVAPWRDTVIGFHTLPVVLYRFHDGYYIRAATLAHSQLVGARVTRIGAVSIDSAESLVDPLISRDNPMGVWQYAAYLLQMPDVLNALGLTSDATSASFTVERDGVTRSVTLTEVGRFPALSGDVDRSWNARSGWTDLRDGAPTPLWLSRAADAYWFTYLPSSRHPSENHYHLYSNDYQAFAHKNHRASVRFAAQVVRAATVA